MQASVSSPDTLRPCSMNVVGASVVAVGICRKHANCLSPSPQPELRAKEIAHKSTSYRSMSFNVIESSRSFIKFPVTTSSLSVIILWVFGYSRAEGSRCNSSPSRDHQRFQASSNSALSHRDPVLNAPKTILTPQNRWLDGRKLPNPVNCLVILNIACMRVALELHLFQVWGVVGLVRRTN